MGLAEWKGPTFVINSSHLFHFVPSPSFTTTTHQNELWLNLIQSTRSTHRKIGFCWPEFCVFVLRWKEKAKSFFSSCFSFGYWLVRFSNCLGSELGTWTIPFTKLSECMIWIHHHHHHYHHHHHRNHCNHHLLVQVFVSPCVLLLYPVWILPVTLGLGFYGGLRQVNLLLALLFFAFVLFLCLASKGGSDRWIFCWPCCFLLLFFSLPGF